MGAIGPNGGTRKWVKIREVIMARDRWLCQVCGNPAQQVDHIVSRMRGGSDDESNLQAICDPCHNAKTQWDNDKIARHLRLTMPHVERVDLDRLEGEGGLVIHSLERSEGGQLVEAGGFPVVIR